ncbi:Uma2 family endonuclease [Limnoraphis robusta]|uniref:Uma2 family endonuclease n=1 Tax=Limnoraphis robusta TaxID=1118279 RepID=UPI002B205E62|nr:Uma2 family endonuclease [Limnoraphis robusta]MEA5499667.1 Uma2 family endonuclease [Limnoraphis robusta BA-68 BA1]
MIEISERQLTLEEFLALPETKPASEYIDGKIVKKPMPQGKHSTIQAELILTINSLVSRQRIARAFPELRCTFGGRSIVPDVTVFSWERIPRDENGNIINVFNTYPDWTIEILSPNQSPGLVTGNILHCLNNGSSLGWLIYPEEESVLVFPHQQQPQLFQTETDELPIPEFMGEFKLTVGEMFGWLKL